MAEGNAYALFDMENKGIGASTVYFPGIFKFVKNAKKPIIFHRFNNGSGGTFQTIIPFIEKGTSKHICTYASVALTGANVTSCTVQSFIIASNDGVTFTTTNVINPT